ncbi:MAG: hypothetical protein U0791_19765 [Gemmataceae bacterium]
MRMLGSILTLVLCGFAAAEDKDNPAAPAGAWVREASGFDLKIEFTGKDVLKLSAMADANGAIVTSKYAVKDGVVKAKITKVEVKGEFKAAPKEGVEFRFKWKVKGDTATLDDFEGDGLEHAKPVLEGEYAKKKAKD